MPTPPQRTAPTPGRRGAGVPTPPVAPRPSRLARLEAEGLPPDLPPLSPFAEPLVTWLFEAGPVEHGGVGPAPLSWRELRAWQASTGVVLQPWQATLLQRLSGVYLAELRAAEAPDALAPVHVQASVQRRASVARRIGLEFRALAAAQRAGRVS